MWQKSAAFWNERDAWATTTIARQAHLVGRATPQSRRNRQTLTEIRGRWDSKADAYLAKYGGKAKFMGQDKNGIIIDPPSFLIALESELAVALAEAWDEELAGVMSRAFDAWPFSSGYSKSELSLSYQQSGDLFIAIVGCQAPYAAFIANSPTLKLIQGPAIEAAAIATHAAMANIKGA